MQIRLNIDPSRNESALLSSALLFSHTFSKMYYLLALCIMPNDFACYIVTLPLGLVPSRKIGICLKPVLCPCPSKDRERRKIVGEHQRDLPSMDTMYKKYSYNLHKSATF